MKIELKKISFNERMSEETNAFVADLYINGKNVGYTKNDGRGGPNAYYGNSREDNQVIQDAENYFKSLPKVKPDGYTFEYQPTLETAIDDCFEEWLKAKEEKKMQKIFNSAIVFGVPNGGSYQYLKTKVPLSKIPKTTLQTQINRIALEYCKDGVVILNNNLEALGITIP